MEFAYIRVSTKEQNTDRQIESLKEYVSEENTFIDKSTGKNFNRPKYQELKKVLRSGDILYIKSLDRLGRSKTDTLKEIRELQEKGIVLKVLDLPTTMINYTDNDLMLQTVNNIILELYTMMAEQELQNIRTRQAEGINAMPINESGKKVSKKTGKETGRPTREISKEFINKYQRVLNKELNNKECMELLKMSKSTYFRYKKEYEQMLQGAE